MLAVACTLKNTEVLLLDEPTSALDAGTVKRVEGFLASLPGSSDSSVQAVLWITHSEDQTRRATRLIKVVGNVEEQHLPADV
ncbi:hypothetical protein FRB99_002902 [Tulasnella sp. 403]|nr:hypothetical protein FRB99_002902 [Tulasnella sp. 403]